MPGRYALPELMEVYWLRISEVYWLRISIEASIPGEVICGVGIR